MGTQRYDQRWADKGNCSGLAKKNPKLYDQIFFPEKGRPPSKPMFERFCKDCPVRAICYKYALVNDLDGIWGSTTKAQRDNLPYLIKLMFIDEAKSQGYLEKFAAPTAHRRTSAPVIRDEFEELTPDLKDASDFTIEYFYQKYMSKVERLMDAIEESVDPSPA